MIKLRIVQHWLDSADNNHETMIHLVDSKNYSWALYLGHLVIEKTLKALYVKRLQKHAIFSHDLLRLSKKIDLRIEPHPIGESDFTNMNPFAYEIQNTGIEIGLK